MHRSYTARGELHQISQKVIGGSLTVIDTRVYDDTGRMISSSYDNGVSQVHSYNADNTLAGIAFSGASIGDLAYTWDANHNKLSESISGVMSGYGFTATYDAEDRLISCDQDSGSLDQAWNLSAVGAMNSVTTNATVQTRSHGAAHELLSVGSDAIQHDSRGNVSLLPAAIRPNGQALRMYHDFDNRLVYADIGDDGTTDLIYLYDAFGRRVYSHISGVAWMFHIHSGQQTIADYIATSPTTLLFSYIYGSYIDEPVLRYQHNNAHKLYYHRNHQYSVIALTDATGAIAERYAYSAYGELTVANTSGVIQSSSPLHNRQTYTGREWDAALHLYHFRARDYDAALGRFCSRDSFGYFSSTVLYKSASAFTGLDPLGHFELPEYTQSKWKKIGGTTYKADSGATKSLRELARDITGDPEDWVCIWPTGEKKLWERYPEADRCATADVRNLVADTEKTLRMRQSYVEGDEFMQGVDRVWGNGEKVWNSGSDAAEYIKTKSGEGKDPVGLLILGAHHYYGAANVDLGNNPGGPIFNSGDIFSAATEKNNSSNSLDSAWKEIGPPRCWFAREAKAYAFACSSHPVWTTDWANRIMRKSSQALGAEPLVYAEWKQSGGKSAKMSLNSTPHINLNSLQDDSEWKSVDGRQ